jgi:hypothetical protein
MSVKERVDKVTRRAEAAEAALVAAENTSGAATRAGGDRERALSHKLEALENASEELELQLATARENMGAAEAKLRGELADAAAAAEVGAVQVEFS